MFPDSTNRRWARSLLFSLVKALVSRCLYSTRLRYGSQNGGVFQTAGRKRTPADKRESQKANTRRETIITATQPYLCSEQKSSNHLLVHQSPNTQFRQIACLRMEGRIVGGSNMRSTVPDWVIKIELQSEAYLVPLFSAMALNICDDETQVDKA